MAVSQHITRRGALSMMAAAVLVTAVPLPATSEDEIGEIIRLLGEMPPMRRLFMKQQIYSFLEGERNVIDLKMKGDDLDAAYEEWLSGFHPEVIALIESGRWDIPTNTF